MISYDTTQLLYRLAFASGMRAADRAGVALKRGGDIEREQRSRDARIVAVLLAQVSRETWINRAFEATSVAQGR